VNDVARFPYLTRGEMGAMPVIPVTLKSKTGKNFEATALLDTGAAINVLPYHVGLALDLNWDDHKEYPVQLGGAFRGVSGYYIKVLLQVGNLPVQEIAFGWMQSDDVPVLLGNINFFQRFDVCFSRSSNAISVRLSNEALP
jgi:hypothetical protein